MKVKDIMTKNVVYVSPTTTITEAAQLMQKHNIGSLPVVDQNKVVGMITDRDIVVRNVAHGTDPHNTKVQDVMTSRVETANPDMDVDDVAAKMSSVQVRRMPVVENNQLVGMVALGDLATNPLSDTEASEALTEISKPSKPAEM